MRACGERDAFPASDLALKQALGPDPFAAAQAWRPWRAYAAMHVWAAHADATAAA
jgi:AraC family transcriptional regulator of adaptative response / DNA-3-methyladenine glycosylase II